MMNFGDEIMIKTIKFVVVMLFVSGEFWWICNINESAVLKFFAGLFVSGDEGDVEYCEEAEGRRWRKREKNSCWWFTVRYNGSSKSNCFLLEK